jgi:hypothetical protein
VAEPTPAPEQPPPKAADPGPRPGKWYDLLAAPPTPLFWENATHNHMLLPNPAARELRVDVPYVGLLGLGRAGPPGYRFQVGIRQTTWVGGVGVIFGYRDAEVEGQAGVKYQFLELVPAWGKGDGTFVLTRSWASMTRDGDRFRMVRSGGLASAPVGRPTDSDEYILEIVVDRTGLKSVSWNGAPLPRLVDPALIGGLGPDDADGWYGLYNRRSNSVFSNTRVKLSEGGGR